jgi:hypothetical protein
MGHTRGVPSHLFPSLFPPSYLSFQTNADHLSLDMLALFVADALAILLECGLSSPLISHKLLAFELP